MAEPGWRRCEGDRANAAFLSSLRIQRRVIGALITRETYTRFRRENLGFAWVFGEFLIFGLPVMLMWHFIRGKYEHGLLMTSYRP